MRLSTPGEELSLARIEDARTYKTPHAASGSNDRWKKNLNDAYKTTESKALARARNNCSLRAYAELRLRYGDRFELPVE